MLGSLVLLSLAFGALACDGPAGCSYNGACENGACTCYAQFQGDKCDKFKFQDYAGEGLRTIDENGMQVSSWGGSVLLADDGKYHMWAAEMTDGVGIKAWITNSQVVHAVADAPEDSPYAFRRREVVQPVFAHEPTVSRDPDTGDFVMFYTTNYGEAPGSQCNPPCDCGSNGTSCLSCPNDQQCKYGAPLNTFMAHASAPDGPWSTPVPVPQPGTGDTNLACIIRPGGALVCMGRPGLGMLFADNWRNVTGYHWQNFQGSVHGEDPMLWVDTEDDSVLHAVTHGGGWSDPFGFHYWSTDGGNTWLGTGSKVYQNHVQLRDGGEKILSRRERPHVVLGKGGKLLALTNGVSEAWPCALQREPDRAPCPASFDPFAGKNPDCGPGSNGTSIWCPIDYCYTMWQTFSTD
eukprot:g5331.t1